MMTPPRDGLTRENTGFPHDVYRGWFLTPEGLAESERLAERRLEIAASTVKKKVALPPAHRRAYKPKACVGCGETFTPRINNAKYCNPKCGVRHRKKARKVVLHATTCVVCGVGFEAPIVLATGKPRQTCTVTCQGEMLRQRRRGGSDE